MLHAGGGLAHDKEETGFSRDILGHALTKDKSSLLQNRAGRFKPAVKLL